MADDYAEMEERFLDMNAEYLFYGYVYFFSLLTIAIKSSDGNDAQGYPESTQNNWIQILFINFAQLVHRSVKA
jgi:hypothetical protein